MGKWLPRYTEIYGLNFRTQSKYGKKWTRKNSVFGHFSHSEGSYKIARIIKMEKMIFSFST